MPLCEKCGKNIAPGIKFCEHCGAPFEDLPLPPPPPCPTFRKPPAPASHQASSAPAVPPKIKRITHIYIALGLLVIVIIIALVFVSGVWSGFSNHVVIPTIPVTSTWTNNPPTGAPMSSLSTIPISIAGAGEYVSASNPPCFYPNMTHADIRATPVEGTAPLRVNFFDNSSCAPSVAWQWDFGSPVNLGITTMRDPVMTYTEPGIYNVTLLVINAFNNNSTKTNVGFIHVLPPVTPTPLPEKRYNNITPVPTAPIQTTPIINKMYGHIFSPANSKITAMCSGICHYKIGETAKMMGTNRASGVVYLFILGPNLNENGTSLDPGHLPVKNGNPSSFSKAETQYDFTWDYKWEIYKLFPGDYTIYATAEPNDYAHLGNDYSAERVEIF